MLFPSIINKKKLQDFPDVVTNTKSPNCVWDKPNLFVNTSLCSDSFQYAIFPQLLVRIGPDILMKVLEDYILILYLGRLRFT